VKLSRAIDAFIADYTAEGRINSPHTRLAYRTKLDYLAEVSGNRDPAKIGPEDIKLALSRWERNSRRQAHAIYRSFFRWAMTEQIRTTNPAEMVRATRSTPPQVARLTKDETARFLLASNDKRRDRWLAHLGCCAGLRSQELRGLQGRHFARPGFIWVSPDLGKGMKERYVPVIADLKPVVDEILTLVGLEEHVLPGQRSAGHPTPEIMRDTAKPVSASAIYKQTVTLGAKAGIGVRVTPHVMRRAFATHVARYAGVRVAQSLLGHVSIETTQGYTNDPTLDELAVSLHGISFYAAPMPSPTTENTP
jgi:site-specific recombinase XerD